MLNDSFKTAKGMKKEEEFEVHVQAAFVWAFLNNSYTSNSHL